MMIKAVVSTVEGVKYRVATSGIVSMPITALEHVTNIQVGDLVMCWFSGSTLVEGTIIGRWQAYDS